LCIKAGGPRKIAATWGQVRQGAGITAGDSEEKVEKKLMVTQVRSYIGRPERQRAIVKGLGLGRINKTVCLPDTPEIRGMVAKVSHLVTMREVEEGKI
jgi:large subunit ribosomal protein L30